MLALVRGVRASDISTTHSGFGYKKDDPSTWKTENLPVISEKGSE